MNWARATSGYDEIFDDDGRARPHYAPLISILESFTKEDVERRERLQKLALLNQGITFTVYGEKEGLERIFPFDFVPRIIPAAEWKTIQDGLGQRITTLNLFLLDVYQEQRCLKDRVIPPELVLSRAEYKRELLGLTPPKKIFTHGVGTDLIRSEAGEYLVLEDNCRCPSGVSYVLENRTLLNRVFPEFFASYPVRPVKEYPALLLDTLLFDERHPHLAGEEGVLEIGGGLLRGLSSLENYRKVHGARMEPADALEFLLFDQHTPRSLRYGTAAVKDLLDQISSPSALSLPARVMGKLAAELAYQGREVLRDDRCLPFLDNVLGELGRAHDTLSTTYFGS